MNFRDFEKDLIEYYYCYCYEKLLCIFKLTQTNKKYNVFFQSLQIESLF